MSVSRTRFLKSLGASMAGWAGGAGLAAAQALTKRVAAISPEAQSPLKKEPSSPVPFIQSGPATGREIAITFDDGPTPGVTERILDELKTRNIPSTFFMIGRRVVAAPELARRVAAEGHEIGNHTFNHLKLKALSDRQADWEIQQTQNKIDELLDYRPAWLRPPFGAFRRDQAPLAAGQKLGVVLWSVDSRDWSQPGEHKIVETILAETKPGSIILCHDLYEQTASCVGRILDGLLEKEFTFATVSSLVAQQA